MNVCKILMICTFCILLSCAEKNMIYPGTLWPDDKGVHINAHGGGVVYSAGRYYWFGESKNDGTSVALSGVSCYSSSDLIHWTNEGIVLAMSEEPGCDIEKGCILERPKVIYNASTDKYVMWFHLEMKGRGYDAARAGVAVSDKITGPYTFVHSSRVCAGIWPLNMSEENCIEDTTGLSQSWWTPEWRRDVENGLLVRRDFKGGQMSRDMTLYVDADGKAYHIYSSEENLTLQIAELTPDYLSHTGRYVRVAPGGHNEAPTMFKKDGKYWMITSGCTGWEPNAARLFSADSIWGTWKQYSNPCVGHDSELTFKAQSTFVLKVEGKKDAFIFMADRWNPERHTDGRYIWLPICWEDGVPTLKWYDKWSLDMLD